MKKPMTGAFNSLVCEDPWTNTFKQVETDMQIQNASENTALQKWNHNSSIKASDIHIKSSQNILGAKIICLKWKKDRGEGGDPYGTGSVIWNEI